MKYCISLMVVLYLALFCYNTAGAVESTAVEASFKVFCDERIEFLKAAQSPQVGYARERTAFVAQYTDFGKEYDFSVKKTKYKTSPYIGILKYKEKKYISTANTRQKARKGPFTCTTVCPVTEIFVYHEGKWQE